jgi:hypothetical protein
MSTSSDVIVHPAEAAQWALPDVQDGNGAGSSALAHRNAFRREFTKGAASLPQKN